MKKFVILCLTVLVLVNFNLTVSNAQEPNEIKIIMVNKMLNYEYLECNVNPFLENDYTLVPLRPIAEKLGFTVEWDESNQSIKLRIKT